jgi:hypothetical protein
MKSRHRGFFILLFLLALAAYTNPTMEKYQAFVHQEIIRESSTQDAVGKGLGLLFGGLAIGMKKKILVFEVG